MMFDELFSAIKSIFVIALVIIVIAFVLFFIWLLYASNEKEKEDRAKAEKKRKEEEFFEKRRKCYQEGLPAIYAQRSKKDLEMIYEYLEIMHYNDQTDDDKHYNIEMIRRWSDAREKLLAHLGYPRWKWLDRDGYSYTDSPILVTEDMNYVYGLIQSCKNKTGV